MDEFKAMVKVHAAIKGSETLPMFNMVLVSEATLNMPEAALDMPEAERDG